jgi:hypothetical protein
MFFPPFSFTDERFRDAYGKWNYFHSRYWCRHIYLLNGGPHDIFIAIDKLKSGMAGRLPFFLARSLDSKYDTFYLSINSGTAIIYYMCFEANFFARLWQTPGWWVQAPSQRVHECDKDKSANNFSANKSNFMRLWSPTLAHTQWGFADTESGGSSCSDRKQIMQTIGRVMQ